MPNPDRPSVASPTIAGEPDLAILPRRVDRRVGAALVTTYKFPVSARALQDWPLEWIVVNAKSTCDTAQLFEVAEQRLAAGRRPGRRGRPLNRRASELTPAA